MELNNTATATACAPVRKSIVGADYATLLPHSFECTKEIEERVGFSRLEYLAESIFGFAIYDLEMAELFAEKAVEVCAAISGGRTFEYIENSENYRWYLLMCNMPFFAKKLEWGMSIRGAWWNSNPGRPIEFQSCGLFIDGEQFAETEKFSRDEWERFIAAVIAFADPASVTNRPILPGECATSSVPHEQSREDTWQPNP